MASPSESPTPGLNQDFPTDPNQTPHRGSIFNQTSDQGSISDKNPDQGSTSKQTPRRGSIFNRAPEQGSNQTRTPNSDQRSTSRPDSGTNTGRDIRTLPIDLNSAIFPSDGKAQQQTQYVYLVLYREALTHHFKEHPHYAEILGQLLEPYFIIDPRYSRY